MGGPFIIPTCDVTFSSHGIVPSSLHLYFYYVYPSNLNYKENVVMSLNEYSHNPKDNLLNPSKVGVMKWKYDATTKFLRQMGNKIPMG
jgi:hypothetical protein